MNVWIFQTGEPLPLDANARPMRAINVANAMVESGHSVVLWSSAFYHQEKVHRCDGYKKIKVSSLLEVRLIPSPGYKKNIGFARFFDHIVLARNLKRLLASEKGPDIAFVGYPPIESSSVMVHWLSGQGIPCVLDVKDQWPDFIVDALPDKIQSIGRMALYPYYYLAKRAMREATGLIAMADDFLAWALNFSGRDKGVNDRVVPLTALTCTAKIAELETARRWWDKKGVVDNGKTKIMFVGSHYPSLDFSPIFEAAKIFIDQGEECEFIICGHGELTESLMRKAEDFGSIFLPGWVDRPKIEELARMSTALIAPFKNIDCYTKSLPNKIIDALSLGLPILSPLSGEVNRLINAERVGLIYKQGSGVSLYDCISKLKSDKDLCKEVSKNSLNLYHKKFSYEIVYGGLVSHLESMVSNNDR